MTPIIKVENLSKQYRIGASRAPYATIRESLVNAASAPFRRLKGLNNRNGRDPQSNFIWALKDVSFEVMPGEVVGVIGRNGAGKSTLLKTLSRITEPTAGQVDLYGRVGSLLEVGTGFHAELTGRENIYLNGAVLGMKRGEIARKFDEIIAFAEVERFIDTPVKYYSSGMYLRLAFAVAAHLEPEVLVVDEVLAVGDTSFQKKCLGQMDKMAKSGRTVLFVSHHLGAVTSLCSRAILLDNGTVVQTGPATEVVRNYLDGLKRSGTELENEIHFAHEPDLAAQLLAVRLTDRDGNYKRQFDLFEPITVEIDYVIRRPMWGMVIEAYCSHQGEYLFASYDTDTCDERLKQRDPGVYRTTHQIPCPLLGAGHYELLYGIGLLNAGPVYIASQTVPFQIIEESANTSLFSYDEKKPGKLVIPIEWRTSQLHWTQEANHPLRPTVGTNIAIT